MALIIEDGSIVPGANSFVTVAECRDYCDTRGLALPTADSEVEALLVNAVDYLNALEPEFQGDRISYEQELVFPRAPVIVYGSDLSNEIPKQLKDAQCRLGFDVSQNALLTSGDGRSTKKEKVSSIEVEYQDDGVSNPQVTPTAALTILAPLFHSGSQYSILGHNINIPVIR